MGKQRETAGAAHTANLRGPPCLLACRTGTVEQRERKGHWLLSAAPPRPSSGSRLGPVHVDLRPGAELELDKEEARMKGSTPAATASTTTRR